MFNIFKLVFQKDELNLYTGEGKYVSKIFNGLKLVSLCSKE